MVEEGSKVHDLVVYRAHVFGGDQPTEHAHGFADVEGQVGGENFAPEAGFEHVERGKAEGEANEYMGANEAGVIVGAVYAGRFNGGAIASGFVEIDGCLIEASEIVDNGREKLQGVIGFQEKALVAFYGKGCGVCFGKGVPGKRFYLPPNLACELFGIAFLATVVEKAVDELLHFLFGAVFSTHGSAKYVGIGQVEAGEVVADFDNIFLIDHNAESFFQLFFHHRVEVLEGVGIVEAKDVFAHHA